MASYFLSVFIFSSLSIPTIFSLSSDCNNGACTPLSPTEKQKILDLHNELRDRVAGGGLSSSGHPAATEMNSVIWDAGLENVAQAYVETCPGLNHNDNRGTSYLSQRDMGNVKWGPDTQPLSSIYVGENLAVSGGYSISSILSQIETGWFDEWQYWSFGNHNSGCQSGKMCGHYTQVVWANTRYIGCGYTNGCSSGGWAGIFVCNYFPAGNFNSIPPYEEGSACSNCQSDRTDCKSDYISQSNTADAYPAQPYHALCDGGACPTMCDGGSYGRSSCDGTGCDGSNIDCDDGTISKSEGRDICGSGVTSTPTTPTNAPVTTTLTPTTTASPTAPTTTTLSPTNNPASGPASCYILSNYQFNMFNGPGKWQYNGIYDSKPSYIHSIGGYYLEWISAWGYNALHDPPQGSTTIYGYCDQLEIADCTAGTWYYWNGQMDLDEDATITPCPATPNPTLNPTKIPTSVTNAPTTAAPTVYKKCCHTDCVTAQVVTGCAADIQCQEEICTADTYCCETEWDGTCAGDANTECISTLSPTGTTPNPTVNTLNPTKSPTKLPSSDPSQDPSRRPTEYPSRSPTKLPSTNPSTKPTDIPTKNPTPKPTDNPIQPGTPTKAPSNPTLNPTKIPTKLPSSDPSQDPSRRPTDIPTLNPSKSPTKSPSSDPSQDPSRRPTEYPSRSPTKSPLSDPTTSPTKLPSMNPSTKPTDPPTKNPTPKPTDNPIQPGTPTKAPSNPTPSPTTPPSKSPTKSPTTNPSKTPTKSPSKSPSTTPSSFPSQSPTKSPTKLPTNSPITSAPTKPGETRPPSLHPTPSPSQNPSTTPTKSPSQTPTTTSTPTQHPISSQPPTTCSGTLSTTYGITIQFEIHWITATVDVTFECPLSHWCGAGFDAVQMTDNAYALIINSESMLTDVQLSSRQYTAPLSNSEILTSQLTVDTNSKAILTIPSSVSTGFNYDKIISDGNIMKMIWAVSSINDIIWSSGTYHVAQGTVNIRCLDHTFAPSSNPSTENPTPTDILPTESPSLIPWNQCESSRKCKYQIEVEVVIDFTYDTDVLDEDLLTDVIQTQIQAQWGYMLDDNDNIDITTSITDNGDGTGTVQITIMVGADNEDIYNDHFTVEGDNGSIENGLQHGLENDGFNIETTSSTFTLLELFSTTVMDAIDEPAQVQSSGSKILDFGNYVAVDWILFIIIVLVLIIIIALLIFCVIKMKKNKAARETSMMGVSTGIKQSEMFRIPGSKHRPQAVVSFGSKDEFNTQDTFAFDTAIAGVALIKSNTNADIIEGNSMQTHIIAADPSPEALPVEVVTPVDFNDEELMIFGSGILDDRDGALPETNDAAPILVETDNYAAVHTVADDEYEYVPETKVEPVAVPTATILPPVPIDAWNDSFMEQECEELITEPVEQIEVKVEPEPEPEPEPKIEVKTEPEPEIEVKAEAEIVFLSIEEAKNLKGKNKETFLNDEDFKSVFGMSKDEFNGIAGWKRKNLKKAKGFF